MTHPANLHAAAAQWSHHKAAAALADHRAAATIRAPHLGPARTRPPRSLHALAAHTAQLRDERPDRGLLAGAKVLAGPAPIPLHLVDLDHNLRAALADVHLLMVDVEPDHIRWRYPRLWEAAGGAPWLGRLLQVEDALLSVGPGIAAEAERILTRVDVQVRSATGIGQDLWTPPLAPECPACRVRRLRVHMAAPWSDRHPVVCHNDDCRCLGAGLDGPAGAGGGCPCGMTTRVPGARHIWPAGSPLAASVQAGAALARAAA